MQIKEQLEAIIGSAIEQAIQSGGLTMDSIPEAGLERPKDEGNGDWASTVAMRSAKLAGMPPRAIAEAIVKSMPDSDLVSEVEIAGPGFINIRLSDKVLQDVVRTVRAEGDSFGKGSIPEGERYVNLEYISANPTGPLHVGHGRWATLGDSMARLMRHAGYDVFEEFYVNDHGTQMDVFGNSVSVRYMQLLGHDIKMPEQSYGGNYVKDIAQGIIDKYGNKYEDMPDEDRAEAFKEIAYKQMLQNQKDLLARYGVSFDRWFSERLLYAPDETGSNSVDSALQAMRDAGYVYEKDGAVWFKSTDFGDSKDRVLIKANGEYTYFMSDVAYHYDKIQRGYDLLIDLWGADHHGYIKRCQAMLEAWGYPDKLEVVLGQLVNLLRNGEPVRMSKRTGEMVTFEELVDEVGVDSTRFLMLSRSSDQPIDFDIEVAKVKDSSNPVYYVQYAHARICSIILKAANMVDAKADQLTEKDVARAALGASPLDCDLSALTHESELALMRKMADFPSLILSAAKDRAPFKLTHYAQELASLFHGFYTNCKVIGIEEELQTARLALCDSVRIMLYITLSLMGISAPIHM